jgi:NAD-dependent DNA ligase
VEREEVEETVARLGGTYVKDLSRVVTHLIATTMDSPKVNYAKQWGIPIVTRHWMLDAIALQGALYFH